MLRSPYVKGIHLQCVSKALQMWDNFDLVRRMFTEAQMSLSVRVGRWRTALLVATMLLWPALAQAQPQAAVLDERLLIELPAGWKVGYTAGEAGRFNTVEYVLETETIATWTRLLNIQSSTTRRRPWTATWS